MSPLRVVFDSNVFGPERFDLLDNSPMRRLCKEGRIVAIYGDRLLDETLRTYGDSDKRDLLVTRWLPFIKETTGHMCLMMTEIWDVELVQDQGPNAEIYMRIDDQQKAFDSFNKLVLDGSWPGWDDSKAERQEDYDKTVRMRGLMKGMRQTATDWREAKQYDPNVHGPADIEQYMTSEMDVAGRGYIMEGFLSCQRRHAIAERWSLAKDQYPFLHHVCPWHVIQRFLCDD